MSIEVHIIFSIDQAVSLFRDAGLEVTKKFMPLYFKDKNGTLNEETTQVWTVLNPRTNTYENLEPYFRKFIELKKQELFLQADKLQIFNLFEK